MIPGDGEVVEGIASVDESAITGESAPVIRESGGDRSAVTGGTRVLSDQITVKITSNPGETFIDRMIKLVEGAERQKTPNEIALNILLAGLTIIFLLAVVTLQPFAVYSGAPQSLFVLVALLVCLIPDDHWRIAFGDWNCRNGPAGAAKRFGDVRPRRGSSGRRGYSAAGQDRHNHVGKSRGYEFVPAPGVNEKDLATPRNWLRWRMKLPKAARSWCWRKKNTVCADGNSSDARGNICSIYRADANVRGKSGRRGNSQRREGCHREICCGARTYVLRQEAEQAVEEISNGGGTPLLVTENRRVLGVDRAEGHR